jgi:membrane-anchored protein YejM (alkaline phosphatase superfamily)
MSRLAPRSIAYRIFIFFFFPTKTHPLFCVRVNNVYTQWEWEREGQKSRRRRGIVYLKAGQLALFLWKIRQFLEYLYL